MERSSCGPNGTISEPFPTTSWRSGRRLSFGLGELFPGLSYRVVASLDRSDFDALYRAHAQRGPEGFGDDATKDFVLLHVFDIAPEVIKHPPDLLRVLLRRHYRGQLVPRLLDGRFVQVLRQNGAFASWPLETIVPDREAFFRFLQERWPLFLDRLAGSRAGGLADRGGAPVLEVDGPPQLPFDHDDVSRIYRQPLRRRDAAAGAARIRGHPVRRVGVRRD